MAGLLDVMGIAVLAVDGEQVGLVHVSVPCLVAEIARRLGCREVPALGHMPASFKGDRLRRLRGDLDQVAAFADASRRTCWSLGELVVAPGEQPVPVLDTPQGKVWVHPLRGFELHAKTGVQRVTELARLPGTVRRTPLTDAMVPLTEAAARAQVLEMYERDG